MMICEEETGKTGKGFAMLGRRVAMVLAAAAAGGSMLVGCDVINKSTFGFNGSAVADALLPAISFTALATNGHIYYSASVDTTSISLQNLLKSVGLQATITPEPGGGVRIASALPDGARFVLLVQREASGPNAGQTHVAIEWENASDSKRGLAVLVDLETQSHKKSPPVQGQS
jgi:hypothetical protein